MIKIFNIDYLRLLLSYLVLFQHSFELGGFPYPTAHTLYGSKFAVDAFFIISGFLVYQSFHNNPRILDYTIKRFFRIYPAYLFTIIFFIAVFLFIYNNIIPSQIIKYLLAQVLFTNSIHPYIAGIFNNNPINVVNGALWTLKIEIIFYISVPFLYFLSKKIGLFKLIIVLYFISLFYYYSLVIIGHFYLVPSFLFHQFPAQLKYFATGMFIFYIILNKIIFFKSLLYLFFSLILYLIFYKFDIDENFILRPLLLGFIIFSIITTKYQLIKLPADYSYGIYISHFPILQILISYGISDHALLLIIATALVIIYAVFCWHFVEKPAIEKSHSLLFSLSNR